MPVRHDRIVIHRVEWFIADNPAPKSHLDLQVDEIILRHIPTPAMLPFTVDTLKQQATAVASGLARYTSLLIER